MEEAVNMCMHKVREAGSKTMLIQADMSRKEDIVHMVNTVIEEMGGLDILINNAGFQISSDSHEIGIDAFDRVLATNIHGTYICAREVIKHLVANEKPGVIINVSSIHQIIPKPKYVGYSFSKGCMQNLTGNEGNHGENVKEYYYYLDSTPTHSYMKMLYKYPQVAYPYGRLLHENGQRDRLAPEFELAEALSDAFTDVRYFDITIEYAKADEEDILCQITAVNRTNESTPLHILPPLWFRNTWSWDDARLKPVLQASKTPQKGVTAVSVQHRHLGERFWYIEGNAILLFTENETNAQRLWGSPAAVLDQDHHYAFWHNAALHRLYPNSATKGK
jgi:hypothetical protein